MFKRLFITLSIAAMSVVAASAQTTTVDDFKKAEFYVGYSNGQVDTGIDSGSSVGDFFNDRANFHGVNVSGVYNVSRYFGIKGDVSATFNNTRFNETFFDPATSTNYTVSLKTNNSLYNVVGGVQVKDNSREGSFKPFAHAMVGLGHARTKVSDVQCAPVLGCPVINESFSDNGLAGVVGGGIDFKVSDKIQIRAIQVDWNPLRINGTTDHNLRIGAGIVF